MQQLILEAAGDLEHVSKGLEALMFAIYTFAVTSLATLECESMFGEAKSTLLAKYRLGTQQALVRAGFLRSSELILLQAFVLFLVSILSFHFRSLHETYTYSFLFANSMIIVRFGPILAWLSVLARGSAFIATAPL